MGRLRITGVVWARDMRTIQHRSPSTTQDLAESYGAAVGTAVAVAFGLTTLIKRKAPPGEALGRCRALVCTAFGAALRA